MSWRRDLTVTSTHFKTGTTAIHEDTELTITVFNISPKSMELCLGGKTLNNSVKITRKTANELSDMFKAITQQLEGEEL